MIIVFSCDIAASLSDARWHKFKFGLWSLQRYCSNKLTPLPCLVNAVLVVLEGFTNQIPLITWNEQPNRVVVRAWWWGRSRLLVPASQAQVEAPTSWEKGAALQGSLRLNMILLERRALKSLKWWLREGTSDVHLQHASRVWERYNASSLREVVNYYKVWRAMNGIDLQRSR